MKNREENKNNQQQKLTKATTQLNNKPFTFKDKRVMVCCDKNNT